jgi:hypothetical protein
LIRVITELVRREMVEHAEALFRLYDAGGLAPPVVRTCHIAEFVDSMRGVSGEVAGRSALFSTGLTVRHGDPVCSVREAVRHMTGTLRMMLAIVV